MSNARVHRAPEAHLALEHECLRLSRHSPSTYARVSCHSVEPCPPLSLSVLVRKSAFMSSDGMCWAVGALSFSFCLTQWLLTSMHLLHFASAGACYFCCRLIAHAHRHWLSLGGAEVGQRLLLCAPRPLLIALQNFILLVA